MSVASVVAVASALVCLYVCFSTWALGRVPRWRDEQWFGFVVLAAVAYIGLDIPHTVPWLSGPSLAAVTRAQMAVAAAALGLWTAYGRRRFGLRLGTVESVYWAGLVALVVLTVTTRSVVKDTLPHAYRVEWLRTDYHLCDFGPPGLLLVAMLLAGIVLAASHFVSAALRGDREARMMLVGLAVLLASAVNDALAGAGVVHTPLLIDAAFLLPVAIHAVGLSSRLLQSATNLDARAVHLERGAALRTEALARTRGSLAQGERFAGIGQLAAGVAHEVNNPAAVLRANLAYLRDELQVRGLPRDADGCLADSLEAVDRIASIVRQLSDSGRTAEGPSTREPVLVAAVVRAAIEGLRDLFDGHEVTVEIPEALSVLGRESELVQVLASVLANAAKAALPGEPASVSIRATSEGARVRIDVVDRGSGMTPDVLARLFEPFFTTRPVGQGTGLGLAVARGLLSSMGGELGAESSPGCGTRMRLELDRARLTPTS